MIANQVLQTNIEGMKNITRVDICVMDINFSRSLMITN